MISEVLDIEIDQENPSAVCRPCERKLISYLEFKNMAKNQHKKVREHSRHKRCKPFSPKQLEPVKKVQVREKSATIAVARRQLAFDSDCNNQFYGANTCEGQQQVQCLSYKSLYITSI